MNKIKKYKQFESEKFKLKVTPKIISKRFLIADLISKSSLEDSDLYPQTRMSAMYFCRNGRPSEYYLNGLVDKLKKSGIEVDLD